MPGWFSFKKTGLLAAGGPCFLQSTCNDCDKGIQANDNGCKYASLYHVFHNIRFNTLKKEKHNAEGNGMMHESTNLGDEMKQIRYGKLCVLSASQNKSVQTASLWRC